MDVRETIIRNIVSLIKSLGIEKEVFDILKKNHNS